MSDDTMSEYELLVFEKDAADLDELDELRVVRAVREIRALRQARLDAGVRLRFELANDLLQRTKALSATERAVLEPGMRRAIEEVLVPLALDREVCIRCAGARTHTAECVIAACRAQYPAVAVKKSKARR